MPEAAGRHAPPAGTPLAQGFWRTWRLLLWGLAASLLLHGMVLTGTERWLHQPDAGQGASGPLSAHLWLPTPAAPSMPSAPANNTNAAASTRVPAPTRQHPKAPPGARTASTHTIAPDVHDTAASATASPPDPAASAPQTAKDSPSNGNVTSAHDGSAETGHSATAAEADAPRPSGAAAAASASASASASAGAGAGPSATASNSGDNQSSLAPPTLIAPQHLPATSVRLRYDITAHSGKFDYVASGELSWQRDNSSYRARMEISLFLFGSRVQTSEGLLSANGLAPSRFTDSTHANGATRLERSTGELHFPSRAAPVPLPAQAQDQLSVFLQLGAQLAGNPAHYGNGDELSFDVAGADTLEKWTFVLDQTQTLTLPGGSIAAIHLQRQPVPDSDTNVEVWLAPALGYLPVQIRLHKSNGDVVEQRWSGTRALGG